MSDIELLNDLARRIRINVLEMTYHSGVNGGHLGGAFSSADIFAVLYGAILGVSSEYTTDENRNRFILSKGHNAIAHYATLAEVGIISKEEMMSFEVSGSDFPTHETINVLKGIEFSSGSLGYGASLGVGTALMAKRIGKKYNTYVLLGDGECNEGTVWEALMFASRQKLNNITFIIDINKQQLDGYTKDVVPIEDFKRVCEGFGCFAISVDGNNIEELLVAFNNNSEEKPKVILANTIKGKGLSCEGTVGLHHVRIDEETYNKYLSELRNQ